MAGIPCYHVTFEDLLLVQSEAVLSPKNQDLVVHRLTGEPLTWCLKQTDKTKQILNKLDPLLERVQQFTS